MQNLQRLHVEKWKNPTLLLGKLHVFESLKLLINQTSYLYIQNQKEVRHTSYLSISKEGNLGIYLRPKLHFHNSLPSRIFTLVPSGYSFGKLKFTLNQYINTFGFQNCPLLQLLYSKSKLIINRVKSPIIPLGAGLNVISFLSPANTRRG